MEVATEMAEVAIEMVEVAMKRVEVTVAVSNRTNKPDRHEISRPKGKLFLQTSFYLEGSGLVEGGSSHFK